MKNAAEVPAIESSMIGSELTMFLHKGIWRENRPMLFPEYFIAQKQDRQFFYQFFSAGGHYPINSEVIALLLQGKIDFKTFEAKVTSSLQEQDRVAYKSMQKYLKNRPSQQLVKKTKSWQRIPGFIYVIKQDRYYKIGRSLDINNRVKTYITENPNPLEVILQHKVKDYMGVEKRLHRLFRNKKARGEWFKLSEEDLIKIKTHLEAKSI